MTSCKSCGNSFAGNFCNQCGERVVSDNDFSLKSLLSQALGAIASIDSKWLQTLKFLLFYPGELTAKHVQGVRVNYMRPFQILIVSNIIFYLFLSETDLFRTPSQWFFVENFDGISVMKKVRKISAANDLDINEIAILYDNKSSNLAKGLIFCLIPLFALVGKLLNPNRGFAFGKHLVFATHYLSFVLLLVVLFGETLLLLPIAANRWLLIIPTVIIMMLYYSIGLKRFYRNSWLVATATGVVGVVLINVIIQMYRMGISLLALYTL